MKKRGWIICCLCVLFLVLSGCGRQEQPGITDEEPDEERIEMERRQEQILQDLGIIRA